MSPGAAARLVVAFAAAGCSNTVQLADWSPEPDGGLPDVIEMDCGACPNVGAALSHMRCAIDLCDPTYVRNGDGAFALITNYKTGSLPGGECGPDDTRAAIARFGNPDNDLGAEGGAYAVMATGDWDHADHHSTTCADGPDAPPGTDGVQSDENVEGEEPIYDAIEWRLELTAPPDAQSFSFNYVFFSASYDEGIDNAVYNDKFYVVLEAPSTNEGTPTVINYTACREGVAPDFVCTPEMADEEGCTNQVGYCYIAINTAYSECCWADDCATADQNTDISGTGYECASSFDGDGSNHGSSTGWLRTWWPISPGEEFSLTFHLHDTGDDQLDSSVIVDAFQFHRSFNNAGTVIIE